MSYCEKKMYRIPQYILNNLRCSLCDGYLSVKPVVIKPEDQQICGKCFKLMPTEEKDKCVRQIGLETLAEVLIFPCRYNNLGCDYTFGWCDDKEHEKECPYRSALLSVDSGSRNSAHSFANYHENKLRAQSDDLIVNFQYTIEEIKQTLAYKLRIEGNTDRKIIIASDTPKEDVEICIEGAISFQNTPHPIRTELKIKPVPADNLYESLTDILPPKEKCINCKSETAENIYNCLMGHTSCENCKEKMCTACVKTMELQSKRFCKNYNRGCLGVFSFDEINDHESDCSFNDIKCPLEPCNMIDIIPKLQKHLREDHFSRIFLVNDVVKFFSSKDETFCILCYDGIFKCIYFYYKIFIEIFVIYIGSSKESKQYSYEISVMIDDVEQKKKSRCSNWNTCMLEKGITFDRDQLISKRKKEFGFEAHLRISKST